jgi:arylsulfatase A-like enzyme
MKLSILLKIILILQLVIFPGCREKKNSTEYNVILISIETLRSDHLSCYGYSRNTSPHIDKFAKKTVFFENAYTPWPKTTSSFAAFFTGMYPFKIGIERIAPQQYLDDGLMLLTEILAGKGFKTEGLNANMVIKDSNFNQGFDRLQHKDLQAHQLTDIAIKTLEQLKEKRFLYWIHYKDPHAPYKPLEKYRGIFINDRLYKRKIKNVPPDKGKLKLIKGIPEGGTDAYDESRVWSMRRLNVGRGVNGNILKNVIAQYDAEITFTDDHVGVLLREIKAMGLFNNSIIVLWGDHGESLGDHDYYFSHGRFPYNDCLKIPLMIYHPGLKPISVTTAVSLVDIFPTLLDLLEIHGPPVDGESIKNLMLGKEKPLKKRVIYSFAGYARNYQKIVTDGKWKLIYIPDQLDRQLLSNAKYELYDLENDPGETDNLYTTKTAGKYLLKYLTGFLKNQFNAFTQKRRPIVYDEKTREALKTLGYID